MNYIIYIAAFLLPLDNFPIMFGGAYRPISLIFLTIYFLMNFPKIFHLKFKRVEFIIFLLIVSVIITTVLQNYYLDYKYTGLMDAVFSLIAGVVIYLSLKIFVQSTSDPQIYIKLFKWIIRGYGIALFVGILQLIYIYIIPSQALSTFIGFFVHRNVFEIDRLHFTFSEPSFIGLHMNLILLPAFIILSNTNNLTKNMKMVVYAFLLLTLFSLSIRSFIDVLIFFILYNFFTMTNKNFAKRFASFVLIILISISSLNLLFVQNIFKMDSDHYYRMANIVNNVDDISDDASFTVRTTYTMVGLLSFLDKPLTGYGVGNFYYGYMEHYNEIPDGNLQVDELKSASSNLTLSQYNMYTRLLSELGLSGVVIIILLLYFIISLKVGNFGKFIMVLLFYSQLQFDSFAFIPLYFWIALLQSKFIGEFQLKERRKKRLLKKYRVVWSH